MIAFLLAATAVKLVLAATLGGTADIPQQSWQARAFLAGHDVLDPVNTGTNPSFFPIGHYLLAAGALLAATTTGTGFAFWIKTPAVLADLLVCLLLRAHPRGGNRVALAYMASPVSLLLSVYHGQLHTVAAAAGALALVAAERGWALPSGVVLGLAASVRQHFAILLLVLLRARVAPLLVLGAFAVTVGVVNLPLLNATHLDRTLTPTWAYGIWGYSMLLVQGPRLLALLGFPGPAAALAPLNEGLRSHGGVVYFVWAALFAVWVYLHPRLDPWRAAAFFLVGFYALSPGFGVQWLIWALPFWLVVDRRSALVYNLLAGAYLAGTYWAVSLGAGAGVFSSTANLHVLSRRSLLLYLLVGAVGLLTWAWCVRSAWRLTRTGARPAWPDMEPIIPAAATG